jgi:hypothetical protein
VFLGTVSGSLIALGFLGQASRLGTAFYAFALILLPVCLRVGAVGSRGQIRRKRPIPRQ